MKDDQMLGKYWIGSHVKIDGRKKIWLGVFDRACEGVQDEPGLADAVSHDSESDLQCPSLYFAHNVLCLCPPNCFVGHEHVRYGVVRAGTVVRDSTIVDLVY